jgi:magnesium transporter
MRREIGAGALLGSFLGVIGATRVAVWSLFYEKYRGVQIYGEHWPQVAATIGITLTFVVLWGSLSGSMLPFLLKRLGLDPATSSAPFVATLVDVTGVVIYFTIALFIVDLAIDDEALLICPWASRSPSRAGLPGS